MIKRLPFVWPARETPDQPTAGTVSWAVNSSAAGEVGMVMPKEYWPFKNRWYVTPVLDSVYCSVPWAETTAAVNAAIY